MQTGTRGVALKKMDSKQRLREKLTKLDEEFLRLVAERLDTARAIGELKRQSNEPTRDFEREAVVLKQGRSIAAELNVAPALADELLGALIRESLTTQESLRVSAEARGSGQRALVIGGSGNMGDWLARFLSAQGFAVEVADPSPSPSGLRRWERWQEAGLDQDIIAVATPLRTAAKILSQLAEVKPAGLIFDIGSIKLPLREPLTRLREAGCSVASIHPMFGPNTRLLTDRHVLFVDAGDAEATAQAKALFASTMAELVDMGMEEHDRMIAHVLGLAHALNLTFLRTLTECGIATDELLKMSSTTFDNQFTVAALVAHENPHLYYEIQHLNEYGADVLRGLVRAATKIADTVTSGDEAGFVDIMKESRHFIDGRPVK